VLILKKIGKISDLDASQKEQRIFPLTLGIIYSGIAFLILTYMQANPLVRGLMFCYMTNTIITILITRYWKISIHAIGVGGPIAVLWLAEFQYPIPALLILIAVSYSRVILKAHTILQAVAGALLGLVLTYSQLNFFFM
jgi:membrane-associated phospholipid phosphatase